MNPFLVLILEKIIEGLFGEENIDKVKKAILELIEGEPTPAVSAALDDLSKAPSQDMVDFVGNVLEAETKVSKDQFAKILINNVSV